MQNHLRMFQWDAVNTSPDLGGQNVLKTFEMAIHHNRLMTRTELETGFCRWIYFHLCSKIFFGPLAFPYASATVCHCILCDLSSSDAIVDASLGTTIHTHIWRFVSAAVTATNISKLLSQKTVIRCSFDSEMDRSFPVSDFCTNVRCRHLQVLKTHLGAFFHFLELILNYQQL